jgi:hypothetical protein
VALASAQLKIINSRVPRLRNGDMGICLAEEQDRVPGSTIDDTVRRWFPVWAGQCLGRTGV